MTFIYLDDFSDSSLYAHHVFHAFDVNKNGAISFRVRTNELQYPCFLVFIIELHRCLLIPRNFYCLGHASFLVNPFTRYNS